VLIDIYIYKDLQAVLQFVTGSPAPIGQVFITFEDDEGADAISVNPCGRQLSLSTRIQDQRLFVSANNALIQDQDFAIL